MADTNAAQIKPDGKAFDDFFDSIGKQADQISKSDNVPLTDEDGETPATLTDDEQRVVDEIESLCMNCHANVSLPSLALFDLRHTLILNTQDHVQLSA